VDVIVHAAPLVGPSGEMLGAFAVIVDLSERKRLEEQLRQAQKMEAVGQLAGGIAHDFNNLLTAISGYVGLALERVDGDPKLRRDLGEVARAGERAADLTRQLLAFSRRQVLQPATFDLNEAVRETSGLLGRLLGEHIRIVTSLDPAGCPILADRGQIEQVLMNLAVNARDAQPAGGTLAIETETVSLDAEEAEPDLAPGRYVALRVSDTGSGMDPVTAAHAFEPFFTTKEPGKGTGLGLATVYGIVTQSGGRIRMSSTPGAGTSFEILLARSEPAAHREPEERADAPRGSERILLVEDEQVVRDLTREMLEQRGYDVICAARPDEALELAAREQVDLLLTDVVMPEMNGPSLASILRRARPELPVLFTSGYTADARLYGGDDDGNASFLQKPYSAGELAAAVRTTLDGPETRTGRPEGRPVDSA
jgi:nitrogen-specific signal transduction histidine kinase/CheY-like chemotaxis protein